MPDVFHKHIRSALADPVLQAALDANAERRKNARLQALADLPVETDILRRKAHAIRSQTIQNLDLYLNQFIQKSTANGFILHQASDAEQAIRIVLEIAQTHAVKPIAKSKTMISEEIGLNEALEQAGFRPIETDLGEFIVQLRKERPAHLITPAVHLQRHQIGETFHEKLGIPLTEDIPTLVAAARQTLRETFLDAEVGISGVNFGVSETGSICLVTNEGNGRMVTTLPPVHVALMGLERLVPTMADLAVLLELLPRSATGQKLTVYTSLINSPRRDGDSDGPFERHLILVDNGREALRHSPLADALLCIRCGACLNACPVFREIGGHGYVSDSGESTPYAGPIGSVVSPGIFGQERFAQLARASTLCGACQEACPVDIDLPGLLLRVRAGGAGLDQPRPVRKVPATVAIGLHVYTWFASSTSRFHLAQRMAGLAGRFASPMSGWIRLPAFTGWGYSKDFPRPASRPFHEVWASGEYDQDNPEGADRGAQSIPFSHQKVETTGSPQDKPDWVDRFTGELEFLGGTVVMCSGAELPGRILEALHQRSISALLSWEARHLPPGLVDQLIAGGIRVTHSQENHLRAGLTGALAGIASSGTIILTSGQGCPQTASLLPEVHLAILEAGNIYPDMTTAFTIPGLTDAQAAVLISGPSRTADIELTLTIGVHGPREVLVFLLTRTGDVE